MKRWAGVVAVVVSSALATSSTGAAVPAVAQRVAPPGRTFTVALGGDILTENAVTTAAKAAAPPGVRYDFAPLLSPMASVLDHIDLSICHMELPIGRPGAYVGVTGKSPFGGNLLVSPYELADGFKRGGFDRCSTASNHSFDQGVRGIDSTLDALDDAGISHVGTARSQAEAAVELITVRGVPIAHLSYTRTNNTVQPADWWRLNQGTAMRIVADVAEARRLGAEVVIVSVHLGKEMLTQPLATDRDFATDLLARADIDLLVHHGPHVPQPMETINGVPVYWSVGNMLSGMGTPTRGIYADPRTLDGLLATVRFSEQADGSWTASPWTVLLCNTVEGRRVYPGITALAAGGLSNTIRTQLTACIWRASAVVSDLK